MNKPMIGIIPLIDEDRKSLWMLPGYMDGIAVSGGIGVMLPIVSDIEDIKQLVDSYDGFLFTGGHDVSPSLYNEEKLAVCGACSQERDVMESLIFEYAYGLDKPILGICRGIQLINVLLGGTLYQDLPTQYGSLVEHHMKPPYDKPIHSVEIMEDTPLFQLLKQKEIQVNSYHHQAIKHLSPYLRIMAKASDGIIEGVYDPNKSYIRAIQWHPEFMYQSDINSQLIFKDFITACKKQLD